MAIHTPDEIKAASAGASEVLRAVRPDASPEAINSVIGEAVTAYDEFYSKPDSAKVEILMERSQILTMRYMEVSGMFTAAVQAMKMASQDKNLEAIEAFLDMLVPTKDALTR